MTSARNRIAQIIAEHCYDPRVVDAGGKPFFKQSQWRSAESAADALLAGEITLEAPEAEIEKLIVNGREYIPTDSVKKQLDDAKRQARHSREECGKLLSRIGVLTDQRLDLVRLGARAMLRAAEAACGNLAEGNMEDCMTSAGLTKQGKMRLNAETDAAEHIRDQIHKTCEDSALGYGSYILSESDQRALKALGVTPDWLYRSENGKPSRAELAKAEASETGVGNV